jgi:hypothetical protein
MFSVPFENVYFYCATISCIRRTRHKLQILIYAWRLKSYPKIRDAKNVARSSHYSCLHLFGAVKARAGELTLTVRKRTRYRPAMYQDICTFKFISNKNLNYCTSLTTLQASGWETYIYKNRSTSVHQTHKQQLHYCQVPETLRSLSTAQPS